MNTNNPREYRGAENPREYRGAENPREYRGARSIDLQKLVLLGILVFVVIVFTILNPRFIRGTNVVYILIQNSFVIITGCAVTLLMISGQIDLSVGSTVCLAGMVHAYFSRAGYPVETSFLFAMLVGLAVGFANALMVVKLKITPFIATLGTMYIGRGLSYLISDGLVIREGLPDVFSFLGNESLGPFPITLVALVGVVAVFLVLERWSVLGKHSIAIGGNRTAAILSGINSDLIVITLYVLASLFAAFAGVLMASRLGVGDPNIGIGFEFDVIVAVILGGTSLAGGEGSIVGMIIGALIIGSLSTGLKLLDVFTFFQSIMKGIVLVLAVLLDQNLKARLRALRSRGERQSSSPRAAGSG
jgi:ribose/xylose/arabinose/galactoside ABC-type transport system permease subunit